MGWGASTLLFGRLTEQVGLGSVFVGYFVLAGLAAVTTLALRGGVLVQVDLRVATRELLRDSRWPSFLAAVLLIGCCTAVINGFLSLYLQDLGASRQQIGLAHALASVSELPVMALSPLVLRRWGPRPLLATAGLLYALRMGIYVVAPFACLRAGSADAAWPLLLGAVNCGRRRGAASCPTRA